MAEEICSRCHKKVWDEKQWMDFEQVVDADAKFDGGEWSEPSHGNWLEKNICLCPERCRCGADATHNDGTEEEPMYCCGGMMCCAEANR